MAAEARKTFFTSKAQGDIFMKGSQKMQSRTFRPESTVQRILQHKDMVHKGIAFELRVLSYQRSLRREVRLYFGKRKIGMDIGLFRYLKISIAGYVLPFPLLMGIFLSISWILLSAFNSLTMNWVALNMV